MNKESGQTENHSDFSNPASGSPTLPEAGQMREYTITCNLNQWQGIFRDLTGIYQRLVSNSNCEDYRPFKWHKKYYDFRDKSIGICIVIQENSAHCIEIENYCESFITELETPKHKEIREAPIRSKNKETKAEKIDDFRRLSAQQAIEKPSAKEIINFAFNPLLWIGIIIVTAFTARFVFNVVPSSQQDGSTESQEELQQ